MEDFINYLNNLNMSTVLVIGMLVLISGFIMQQITESRMITALFVLGFQAGALILNYVSTLNSIVLIDDPDSNLIAISTVGMVLGLAVMLVLMRSAGAIADASRPKISR